MKALLVIDMQKGSFKPYSVRHDTYTIIGRINQLTQQFRAKGLPVIFIQHDGSREDFLPIGSDDWQLLPELVIGVDDIKVDKTANDSFYRSLLQEELASRSVDELYITGCATDFCVDATIKSALTKDYKIVVVADAHTTASRPHVDAVTLINHHNWLWSDMSPTLHKMTVVKTDDIQL